MKAAQSRMNTESFNLSYKQREIFRKFFFTTPCWNGSSPMHVVLQSFLPHPCKSNPKPPNHNHKYILMSTNKTPQISRKQQHSDKKATSLKKLGCKPSQNVLHPQTQNRDLSQNTSQINRDDWKEAEAEEWLPVCQKHFPSFEFVHVTLKDKGAVGRDWWQSGPQKQAVQPSWV